MPGLSNMSNNSNRSEERTVRVFQTSGNSHQPVQQQQQQETRSWSTYTTKKVVSSEGGGRGEIYVPSVQETSSTTTSSNKSSSSDLFSNQHSSRRGSNESSTNSSKNNNVNNSNESRSRSTIKSSSLVSKALQEMEDDFGGITVNNECRTVVPVSCSSNSDEYQGVAVPLSYEIVTKENGVKEFQLKLEAKQFNPEDLQVKVEHGMLIISGNHEEKCGSGGFRQKSFSRRCTIPEGVNADELNCSLDTSGRMMITAPVREVMPKVSGVTTTTITRSSQQIQEPRVQTGFKIGPGPKEQVVTIFKQDESGPVTNSNGVTTSSKTVTSKTVRSFKSVA